MDDNNLNLGLGFDSQSVSEATRALKQNIKTIGALFQQFSKLKDETLAQAKAEKEVEEQIEKLGVTAQNVVNAVGSKLSRMFNKILPGAQMVANVIHGIKVTLGTIVGLALVPILLPFKWILTKGFKIINWATDFSSRIGEIKDAALALENRFIRLSNVLGSETFAKKINNWQHEMLQTLPIVRDDLNDFTIAMREMGIDPREANLHGILGAALGPGNSYSAIMSAVQSFAEDGSSGIQGLMDALGNTINPQLIYDAVQGATSQQDRMLKLMNLLDTQYGENVERSSRIISTNVGFIQNFWEQFKESLVGTPQEGNLMWYIQQVFVDINSWIKKNKAVLLTFADSIARVLGGIGKTIYNLFRGMGGFASKSIGGITAAAEKFKEWSMRARIQLEDWAFRIMRVFDKAKTSGAGFWETMKTLWTDVFGMSKPENMLSVFWNKFKEYGSSAIDWLGEKIATVFGTQFRAGVVNSLKKEDGTFGMLVPDFIKEWDRQIESDKRVQEIKSLGLSKSELIKKKEEYQNSLANTKASRPSALAVTTAAGLLSTTQGAHIGSANILAKDRIAKRQIKKDEEYIAALELVLNRMNDSNSVGNVTRKGVVAFNNAIGTYAHPKDANGMSRNSQGGGAADLFTALVGNAQINSTTGGVHKTQNHAKGLATDFQATKEMMDMFKIAKGNRKFGAKKEQVVFDEGGMRIIYEPPKSDTPGLRGHFHVDGGVGADFDRKIAEAKLKEKYGTENTINRDKVASVQHVTYKTEVTNIIQGNMDKEVMDKMADNVEKRIRRGEVGNKRVSAN